MGKISNFTILFSTICVLVVIIITFTTIRINEEHEKKLIYAMKSKVEYYAKRCYLEEKCSGEVTLNDLYEKEYLTEISNPVTKEVISHDIKINYIDNVITIDWDNYLN